MKGKEKDVETSWPRGILVSSLSFVSVDLNRYHLSICFEKNFGEFIHTYFYNFINIYRFVKIHETETSKEWIAFVKCPLKLHQSKLSSNTTNFSPNMILSIIISGVLSDHLQYAIWILSAEGSPSRRTSIPVILIG